MTATDELWVPPPLLKEQKGRRRSQKTPPFKWTGLAGKTLWDWLQLLIIPAVLASVVAWFNLTQTQVSLQASQRQHDTDVQIAADQQQEAVLVTYEDDISNLLLNYNLLSSKPGDEVQVVARARTLGALRPLDAVRKGYLLNFLYEAQLVVGETPIIFLQIADLSTVDLYASYLADINLAHADLLGGYLRYVHLEYADLSYAELSGADLSSASLTGVDLDHANLPGANLVGAVLYGANLVYAELKDADLRGSHLNGADLSYADLEGADLSGADLTNVKVTNQQLAQTKSLKGATLPDGSKHP